MQIIMTLTERERAVFEFLMANIDPEWGEPLNDIEDAYEGLFDDNSPYDSLTPLKKKVDAACKP